MWPGQWPELLSRPGEQPLSQVQCLSGGQAEEVPGDRRREGQPRVAGFHFAMSLGHSEVVFYLAAPGRASPVQKRNSEPLPSGPELGRHAPAPEARAGSRGLGLLGRPAFSCPCATACAGPSALPFCLGNRGTTVRVLPGGAQKALWGWSCALAIWAPQCMSWGRSQSWALSACLLNE